MATKNPTAKHSRPSTRKSASKKPTPLPPPIVAFDPNVTDAAVATLVRALVIALRQTLSFAYVAAAALRRRNFALGVDVAASLNKALDGKLDMDLRELERLMTYVHQDNSHPRPH
jgi:hypothetical protein